jgi:phosphoribosylglycinamide formyltransferase-1
MGTAVLVSGAGTILESILEAEVPVSVVAADRSCRGLIVAARAGVDAVLVDRREFGGFTKDFDREGYTAALNRALVERSVDLVCMSGFGTILAPSFFEQFGGRVLNTHPALLPAHKGWHAVRDTLEAGDKVTGCTVHVATEVLDDGPIISQETVPVLEGDDEETLQERIKVLERRLYPFTILMVRAAMARGQEPVTLERPPREEQR